MSPAHSLINYLRSGHTDRRSRFLSFISPYKVAEDLFTQIDWRALANTGDSIETVHKFRVEAADRRSPVSHPVFRFLDANRHPAIRSVFLFGSLADGTACTYSDFDGIIVIDCSAIKGAVSLLRLRTLISRSEEMMLETDPLQHHGWHFVLTDAEQYILEMDLPSGILEECKSIAPFQPIDLKLNNDRETDLRLQGYRKTIASIRRKLDDPRTISCLYTFKSLCSELMLVPALFIQASGRQISKKDSFKIIESFIHPEDLTALRMVSEWRRNWEKPDLTSKIKLFHSFKRRGVRLSFLLPPIPRTLRDSYTGWKTNAETFISACDLALEKYRHQS